MGDTNSPAILQNSAKRDPKFVGKTLGGRKLGEKNLCFPSAEREPQKAKSFWVSFFPKPAPFVAFVSPSLCAPPGGPPRCPPFGGLKGPPFPKFAPPFLEPRGPGILGSLAFGPCLLLTGKGFKSRLCPNPLWGFFLGPL